MHNLINIAEGISCISAGVWGALYYTGRLNYSGKKEQRRKVRVEKYGWLLIVGIVLASLAGIMLLISNI
jgi:hypothetical protein